jgi:hypothetical protein
LAAVRSAEAINKSGADMDTILIIEILLIIICCLLYGVILTLKREGLAIRANLELKTDQIVAEINHTVRVQGLIETILEQQTTILEDRLYQISEEIKAKPHE